MGTGLGLFERLYAASKEVLDEAKKPFIKKALKRKFVSAHDHASSLIIDAENKKNELMAKFNDFDINSVMEQIDLIDTLKKQQAMIVALYSEMFGEEMKISEE